MVGQQYYVLKMLQLSIKFSTEQPEQSPGYPFGTMSLNHRHIHLPCYRTKHPINGYLSWTAQVSRYQKGKTNLNFLKQETVSGSGIS